MNTHIANSPRRSSERFARNTIRSSQNAVREIPDGTLPCESSRTMLRNILKEKNTVGLGTAISRVQERRSSAV